MHKIGLFIIFSIIMTMPFTYAQEEPLGAQKIILKSDNTSYQEGDVITITGEIEKVIPGMPVSIQIFFEKNLMQVSQVNVSQDGQFTDTFTAAGPQWQNEGIVVIRANYGGETSSELEVTFFKNTLGQYASNYEVKIPNGGTFDVEYTMKGGVVRSMNVNQENLSLEISIATETDGNLNINLPRENIDSRTNDGKDTEFIILMYEENSIIPIQTNYRIIEDSSEYRSIDIPVKNGDSKIEIIGTYVIPEFGAIATMVLAVAIVSIIAVSAKSRLSIMPRI